MAEKALSDKAKIPLGFLVSLCETATAQIEDLRRGTAAAELISGSIGKTVHFSHVALTFGRMAIILLLKFNHFFRHPFSKWI